MNRTIKLLMLSDILILTGFGLIAPILAIFIKDNLAGGTIFAAGLATFIFWTTKSVIQLPLSRYVDKHDDKLTLLIIGTFIMVAVPFVYAFSPNVRWIYFAEFLYGIGSGLSFPAWLGLWSINLDKHHESFEWSLYSTTVGIGTALAAAVGAGIAQYIGFKTTFIVVGIAAFAGGLILFGLEKNEKAIENPKILHYHKRKKLGVNHKQRI